jgi:hypothetical protein
MDYDKILQLLLVHEKASGHPKLKVIVDTAMAELEDLCHPEVKAEDPESIPVDEPSGEAVETIDRRI